MTRISSALAEHQCSPILISDQTSKVADLKGYRGQRSASIGRSVFGEIWTLSEEELENRDRTPLSDTITSMWKIGCGGE